ncbi:MAG: hypothetical protein HRT47_03620 [Candidatus Caenarcaniphilales bacterium]|nr:hypothetical protein [Candidatus Caenarcaniphilales bacterium]
MLGALGSFVKNVVTKPFAFLTASSGAKSSSSNTQSRESLQKLSKADSSSSVENNPGIWVPITAEFKDFSADDKKQIIDYLTNYVITGKSAVAIKQKQIAIDFINNADIYFTKAKPGEDFESYVVEQGNTDLKTQLISDKQIDPSSLKPRILINKDALLKKAASVTGTTIESMDEATQNKIVKSEVARLLSIYAARAAIMTVQKESLKNGQQLRDFDSEDMKFSEYNTLDRTIGRPLALSFDDSGYSLVSAAFEGYRGASLNSIGVRLEKLVKNEVNKLDYQKRGAFYFEHNKQRYNDEKQYLSLIKETLGEAKLNKVISDLKTEMQKEPASDSFNSLNHEFNPGLLKN